MSIPNEYIVGQIVFLEDTITDPVTGDPITDGSDVVTVYQPDGTTSTPAVTAGAAGTYSAQFTIAQPGWHEYVWLSTGAGAGGRRGTFYASPIP